MSIGTTAREIMTTNVVTLTADMTVAAAAESLLREGVSSAPVIHEDFTRKLLVGFVSEKDFIQCYASGCFYTQPKLKVSDVMRPHPVGVRPETDLFTLAAIFMQNGYRHVPVVASGMLEGIVSRRDVLAALLTDYREWCGQDPTQRKVPDISGKFTQRFLLG